MKLIIKYVSKELLDSLGVTGLNYIYSPTTKVGDRLYICCVRRFGGVADLLKYIREQVGDLYILDIVRPDINAIIPEVSSQEEGVNYYMSCFTVKGTPSK
jgi:hypothetical protein